MGGSEGGGSPDGSQTVPVWTIFETRARRSGYFQEQHPIEDTHSSIRQVGVKVGVSPLNEEQIAGRRVFFVDGDALAACFETGLDEAFVKGLAARAPLRVVFRDDGYASDALKINIDQIFKVHSPHTELKTL